MTSPADFSWKTIPTRDYQLLAASREALYEIYVLLNGTEWTLEDLRLAARLAAEQFSPSNAPSWPPTPLPPSRPELGSSG